jgi:hypothetical protein
MGLACCKSKNFSIEPSNRVIAVQPALNAVDNSRGVKIKDIRES